MIRVISSYIFDKMGQKIVHPLSAVIFIFFCNYLYTQSASNSELIHFLKPGETFKNEKSGLQIFCHNANSKYLVHMWKTLNVHLNTTIDNYDLYEGKTPQEVMEKHDDNQRSWRFNLFGTKKNNNLKINPFEDICIGVHIYPSYLHRYTITLEQTRVDVFRVILMLLGIITYWSAYKLSGNPVFYYLCGIALGVTASILILVYVVSKLLPRGKMMYLMVISGWTMSFYLIQALLENAQLIAVQYREWVIWYILITAFISFVICYRFGPVTNVRTKKLIQWFLQIGGLATIYYSSYFREISFFCCIIITLLYNFPIVILKKGKCYWKNMFPERRKLLTEDQYRKEGIRETRKALSELKEYCSSPECNPWKTVLRLKDPIRFAKFMEGDSHLLDNESREHDAEITKLIEDCEYTDDEDDLL